VRHGVALGPHDALSVPVVETLYVVAALANNGEARNRSEKPIEEETRVILDGIANKTISKNNILSV